ncbi:DUF4959 domain-containing protein [Treponema rectale]|uniref:DUF4959 domain-containing protein n=1 Tax=Treponema rectale TaxID=744512 RepID=A0A840S9C6_9SPIR|nr:fibronectin type III domain-containing protein [Treponema rectale]MBB5219289.1 hypothetical protein [Treponema rectale]QOS40826.1 DUF4959 domain-containing protein [Treponema rectale]
MVAKLRHGFAVLCGAAIIFASCSSGGGSSGGGSSTNASLAFSEDVTVTDSANTLTVSDVVPYSEKSFGVYVKDGVPSDITVVSDSAEISVSATEFSEAADSTSGEYLSTVTYALNGFEDASAVITVTVGIDGADTLVGKINLSATVADAVDSYKVSNLVQTLDEDSNPTSDHNVSLSWTLPEDVSVSRLFYRVVQTSEGGEDVSEDDAYDSGIVEISADADSLTTSGIIPSSSEFMVYIYTLTADGWSVTSVEGVKTAADCTPPETPSVTATETSDHSLTFSWTDPSDTDFDYLTVTTDGKQIDGTTAVTVPEKISAGVQTVTFSKLAAGTEYSFTFTFFDLSGNSTTVNVSESTAADETVPSAVTALSAVAGRSSVTLSWTASASDDVKEYSVYVDDAAEASVTVTGTTATFSDLTAGIEYSFAVKAFDYDGNESESVSVSATPVIPAATEVSAAVQYTGSVLVTWTDTTVQEDGITYSYKVTCSDDAVEAVTVESGVQQAHFTGLTVGNNYSFTVTVVDSNSVECSSLDTESVTAKTVIWQILSGYSSDRYLAWASSSSSTVCYNTAAVATSANPTAYFWIVRPSLSGTDGYFSLEAATDESGVGTGYFLYYDTNSRSYVAYNGTWGSGNGAPYAMVATLTGIENGGSSYITDNVQASFKLDSSSYGSAWSKIVCEKDSYYIQHASLTYSMIPSSTSEDSAGCGAFQVSSISYADADYYTDGAPDAVTDLASADVSTTSVTLTYTEPGNADLSFVRISYTPESGTASTVDIAAGSNGTTLTGLTKGVTYTITATAYDVYGNASSATDELTVSTLNLTNIPTNVAATARFTGEILVTWDRAEDDTSSSWQYKVVCSDDGVDEQSFTSLTSYAGTYANEAAGVAQFTGLTSGTSYTFTVYASEDGENWNNDGTVSATAATVTKQIISRNAEVKLSDQNNKQLNTSGAANLLMCQWSTGGGTGVWNIYPAMDGSITSAHTVTLSDESVKEGVYDTFSVYHTNKGYLTINAENLTETASTTLGANISFSTSASTDSTGESTFFMGYSSVGDTYYTLRLNVSSANFALGCTDANDNNTEILYYNDATSATCENQQFAWYFEDN